MVPYAAWAVSDIESKLGFRVSRIEVRAAPSEDTELSWSAWASDEDELDGAIVVGYLKVSAPRGFGQVSVASIVSGRGYGKEESPGDFETWVRQHVLEQLYDEGRRALNVSAGLMDLTLDIPLSAPQVDLERFDPPESE